MNLEKVALNAAKDLASGKLKVNRQKTGVVNKVTEFAMGLDFVKDFVFKKARDQVMKMSGGLYPAPLVSSFQMLRKCHKIVFFLENPRCNKNWR